MAWKEKSEGSWYNFKTKITNLPKYFVDRKIPDWANFYCQRVYVVYVIINITTSLLYTFPFRWPIKKKKKKAKYTITYLCTRLD